MQITFECTPNIAVLMIAFHDIVTDVGPDDSIPAQDYFGWIVDELGERVNEFISYSENGSGLEIPSGMLGLAELYRPERMKYKEQGDHA